MRNMEKIPPMQRAQSRTRDNILTKLISVKTNTQYR
jgi:hypothetical protein